MSEHEAQIHGEPLYSLKDVVMLAEATFEYTEIQVGLYSERFVFTVAVVSSQKQI